MVDVSQHELVPDHAVLDDAEVEAVLEEYDIRKTDLPKIKFNPSKRSERDAALKDLDEEIEPGDVVKIVRDSRTADRTTVYRLVVK